MPNVPDGTQQMIAARGARVPNTAVVSNHAPNRWNFDYAKRVNFNFRQAFNGFLKRSG